MTDKKFVESFAWTAIEIILVSLGMNRLVFGVVFLFTEYISETAFLVLSAACPVLAVAFCVAHYLRCVRRDGTEKKRRT